MEETYRSFAPEDPLVIPVIKQLYINVVCSYEDENDIRIISEIGKQYNAVFGFVTKMFNSDLSTKCHALRFGSDSDMLAFVLRYK